MKVLLTGANGSVGSRYLELFPDTAHTVVRMDHPNSISSLVKEMPNIDVLIHASANLNPKSAEEALNDNAILPFNILTQASEANPNLHLIFISSMSILGEDGKIKDIKDMSPYSASKYIMEQWARYSSKNPITIVRFSSIFYSNPEKDGLSKIVYSAFSRGSIVATDCKRDFIPVETACKWLNKLCQNETWYGKTINLCSGYSTNMLTVANYLVEKYGASCHETMLPEYTNVCYKFDAADCQSLDLIEYDIHDIIDGYYEKLKEGKNGKTA